MWYPWISVMTRVGGFSRFGLNHHPSKTSRLSQKNRRVSGQLLDFMQGMWKNRGHNYWVVPLIFLENHGYEHEKPPWYSEPGEVGLVQFLFPGQLLETTGIAGTDFDT